MARSVVVTPRGRAIYPYLTQPDTKFSAEGVYRVKLAVPANLAYETIERIEEAHKKAVQDAQKENPKKRIREAPLPYEEDTEADEVIFNFKCRASFKSKKGEVVSIRPALFDSKGKPLPKDVRIGGGSIIRVSFEPNPYYVAAVGAGVSLRLKAVQVFELQEYGQASADAYGFEVEEGGYEAPSVTSRGEEEDSEDQVEGTEDIAEDGSDF